MTSTKNYRGAVIGGASTSVIVTLILFAFSLMNGVDPKRSLLIIGLIYIAVITFAVGAISGFITAQSNFGILKAVAFNFLFNLLLSAVAYFYFESPSGNSGIKPIALSLIFAGIFSGAIVSLTNLWNQA